MRESEVLSLLVQFKERVRESWGGGWTGRRTDIVYLRLICLHNLRPETYLPRTQQFVNVTSQWLDLNPEKMEAGTNLRGPMALGPAGDQLPFRGSLVDGLLFTQPRGPR